MILRIARNVVTWLIKQDTVRSEDKELYEYAMYSLLLTISPLILVWIIGGLMGKVAESIFIILPFMFIRKFSGGFHAKHDWTCFLGSCGLLFLCILGTSYVVCSIELVVLTLGAVISLWICSPIDSENRRLTQEEIKQYKVIARMVSLIFFVIFILLILADIEKYAVCIAEGLLLSAGLQIPCVLLRKFSGR